MEKGFRSFIALKGDTNGSFLSYYADHYYCWYILLFLGGSKRKKNRGHGQ